MMACRSETIGSLLRPQYLVDARQQLERGELTAPAFKRIEDRAVDESVALQEAAGLDVITDGEQRRYAFFGHLVEAFEGFDKFGGWAIPFRDDAGVEETIKRPVVVDKLRWRRHMAAEEFTYLRARTNRAVKVTLPERPAGRGLLRSGQVPRGLSDARRLSGRPRRLHAA